MWNIEERFSTLVSLLPRDVLEEDIGMAWRIYRCQGLRALGNALDEEDFCLNRAIPLYRGPTKRSC